MSNISQSEQQRIEKLTLLHNELENRLIELRKEIAELDNEFTKLADKDKISQLIKHIKSIKN